MNFKCALVLFAGLFLFGTSLARTVSSPGDLLSKKGMKRHRMNIGVCHFVINDPFSGMASDGSRSMAGPYAGYKATIKRKKERVLSMQFQCGAGYEPKACDEFRGEIYALDGTIMDAGPPIPHSDKNRYLKFKSVNGNGRMVVYNQIEDVTGPGDQDGRNLSFCLSSPKGAALVGLATIKEYKDDEVDLTEEAIRVVKGIEFDDAFK